MKSLKRGSGWGLPVVAMVLMLGGCAAPPTPIGESSPAFAVALPGDVSPALRPLTSQSLDAGDAGARSHVSTMNYDITVPDLGDDRQENERTRKVFERGGASWYGLPFHQRKTANGERFDMNAMTAAHKTLPFNTWLCVHSQVTGREVLVRINDRGPYASGRVIDLSRAAAEALGMISMGIKQVALSVMDREGMRCNGETLDQSDMMATGRPAAKTAPSRRRAELKTQRR